MIILTIYKFGTIGKKTIELDEDSLSLKGAMGKKVDLNIKDIQKAYIVSATISRNGTVYFSTDGKNSPSAAIDKHGFMYTKGQLKDVESLISETGIEAIYSDKPETIKKAPAVPKKARVSINIVSGKEQLGTKSNNATLSELEPGIVSINTQQYKFMGFDWGEQKYRSGGKAAVGAIVGGALTGGVGLIAGAAIGGKRRDSSKATIHLADKSTNKPIQLIVSCDNKKAAELGKLTMYFE